MCSFSSQVIVGPPPCNMIHKLRKQSMNKEWELHSFMYPSHIETATCNGKIINTQFRKLLLFSLHSIWIIYALCGGFSSFTAFLSVAMGYKCIAFWQELEVFLTREYTIFQNQTHRSTTLHINCITTCPLCPKEKKTHGKSLFFPGVLGNGWYLSGINAGDIQKFMVRQKMNDRMYPIEISNWNNILDHSMSQNSRILCDTNCELIVTC